MKWFGWWEDVHKARAICIVLGEKRCRYSENGMQIAWVEVLAGSSYAAQKLAREVTS